MFIVFKKTADADFSVIQIDNPQSSEQVTKAVGGVNWYGSSEATPESAIEQAKKDGFRYRSADELSQLKMTAESYSIGDGIIPNPDQTALWEQAKSITL